MAERRNVSAGRTLKVLERLMEGAELDCSEIQEMMKTSAGSARRVMAALAGFPGVEKGKRGKATTLSYRDPAFEGKHHHRAIVTLSMCLGTSLASLFAGSSYEKSMQSTRDRLLRRLDSGVRTRDLGRKFFFAAQGGEIALREQPGIVDDVLEAVLRSRYLTIDYTHFNGDEERLRIKPLSVVVYQHQLYVLGRAGDAEPHPYRISRIRESDLEDETFAYPSRSEFDPERLFADSLGVFVGGHPICDVTLRLDPSWATYAETHTWHRSQRIRRMRDGRVELSLRVRACPELRRFIRAFGPEAEVVSPPWLRAELTASPAAERAPS